MKKTGSAIIPFQVKNLISPIEIQLILKKVGKKTWREKYVERFPQDSQKKFSTEARDTITIFKAIKGMDSRRLRRMKMRMDANTKSLILTDSGPVARIMVGLQTELLSYVSPSEYKKEIQHRKQMAKKIMRLTKEE